MQKKIDRLQWGSQKFLTSKQLFVFDFIRRQIHKGLPPSVREIAKHFGFSIARASHVLRALHRKDYIQVTSYRARAILLQPPYKDETRYSLIANSDLPDLSIRKGDFLLIDTKELATDGQIIVSVQGEIKPFTPGDTPFGRVTAFTRKIGVESKYD